MTAVISDDGRYRYRLRRDLDPQLGDEDGTCLFIMLNPSIATADDDDPTIRRCKGFAARMGCSALEVVNLYAYRTAEPAVLFAIARAGVDIVGPENDEHLAAAIGEADVVIAAWGANAKADRVAEVVAMPGLEGLLCLAVNDDGSPKHPLYVRADAPISLWEANT